MLGCALDWIRRSTQRSAYSSCFCFCVSRVLFSLSFHPASLHSTQYERYLAMTRLRTKRNSPKKNDIPQKTYSTFIAVAQLEACLLNKLCPNIGECLPLLFPLSFLIPVIPIRQRPSPLSLLSSRFNRILIISPPSSSPDTDSSLNHRPIAATARKEKKEIPFTFFRRKSSSLQITAHVSLPPIRVRPRFETGSSKQSGRKKEPLSPSLSLSLPRRSLFRSLFFSHVFFLFSSYVCAPMGCEIHHSVSWLLAALPLQYMSDCRIPPRGVGFISFPKQ